MLGGATTPEGRVTDRNTRPSAAVPASERTSNRASRSEKEREGGETMKVRTSLRSLKGKPGSTVVRRHGRTLIINKRHPRWKARQG
jgi:large subunit ribosomal protein L36